MYKLNIIVYVPELETKYDVLIPIDKKVSTILYLLKKGIKDLANLKLKSNVKLYEKTTGKVLNNNLTIITSLLMKAVHHNLHHPFETKA